MKAYRYIFMIAIACSVVSSNYAQSCVECWKNVVGPDLHRRTRTDNNQETNVVTVKIADTWKGTNGAIPQKLKDAVQGAMDQWNAATPNAPRIQFDQDAADDKVSVLINKKELLGAIAKAVPNIEGSAKTKGTMILNLTPVLFFLPLADLTGVIAHEMGHDIKGIAHPLCGPVTNSLMRGAKPDSTPYVSTVQAIDASAAEKFRLNKKDCLLTHEVLSRIEDFQQSAEPLETYQEPISVFPACIETWQYTNYYVWDDGWRYIGTNYELISPACN
jgi:hypothetical protein